VGGGARRWRSWLLCRTNSAWLNERRRRQADLIRVVLADANVLYSRVLRDYLLYAADQEIVAIGWSSQILAEVTEHLMENVEGSDQAAARSGNVRCLDAGGNL